MKYHRILAVMGTLALVAAAFILVVPDASAAIASATGSIDYNDIVWAAPPAAVASLDTLQRSVDDFMNGFEEFKKTNDENIKQRDVVLEDKGDHRAAAERA